MPEHFVLDVNPNAHNVLVSLSDPTLRRFSETVRQRLTDLGWVTGVFDDPDPELRSISLYYEASKDPQEVLDELRQLLTRLIAELVDMPGGNHILLNPYREWETPHLIIDASHYKVRRDIFRNWFRRPGQPAWITGSNLRKNTMRDQAIILWLNPDESVEYPEIVDYVDSLVALNLQVPKERLPHLLHLETSSPAYQLEFFRERYMVVRLIRPPLSGRVLQVFEELDAALWTEIVAFDPANTRVMFAKLTEGETPGIHRVHAILLLEDIIQQSDPVASMMAEYDRGMDLLARSLAQRFIPRN